tara:strand:- start:1700 stop:1924 length:225 start_codon:yes stop_codon:yes gene_type:complete
MKTVIVYRLIGGIGIVLFFAGTIKIGVDYYAKGIELLPAAVALLGIVTSAICSVYQARAEDRYHLNRRYPFSNP